ncbi:DUF262 domain-containing protein [Sphingomonas sp. 3-13AW]|uniref:DUF262 domain-containing protein n=1 Tax=Sphingomonas sp. 3-13AW TaxID=3050450 RepID=UPI003BB596C5
MTFTIRSRGGNHPHFPVRLLHGNQSSTDLEAIIEPAANRDGDHFWDQSQARAGPWFLPPFQRPAVWTDLQKERFVESALLGISLGSLVVVDALHCPMPSNDRFAATDRWLLDGQQRVSALLAYRADEISVFRGTECEHRWSDLGEIERRKFWYIQIGIVKIETDDPDYCREIYDRLNFGGTPHTVGQRALTR